MCRKSIFLILLLVFGLTIGVASGQSTVVRVNFQLRATPPKEIPVGYLPDYGDVFGNRGNGWSYGWTVDKIPSARDRDAVPDQRYDTLNSPVMWNTGTGSWNITVPNGTYNVYIVGGDPGYYDSTQSYLVEDVAVTDPTPYPPGNPHDPWKSRFDEYTVHNVTVADGNLTIAPPAGWGTNYIKICFIHIADVRVAQPPISPPDRDLWPSRTPLLTWTPGTDAAKHDVYLGTSFADVNNATISTPVIYKGRQDANSYNAAGLTSGATYYWRIDEFDGTDTWKGDIWIFKVQLTTAYDPQPFDGEIFVDPNIILSWTKGATAANHLVYFGDNYNSVRDANTSSPEYKTTLPVGTTTWDPPGNLTLNKTYYWRIDEKESGGTVYKGSVWSFTTATRIGGGVKGQYYNNSTWTEPPVLTRIDPKIDFDWGLSSPDPCILPVDSFSVRWTGQVEIPASGDWTFWLNAEHNSNLWVDGQLLISETYGVIYWVSATINLEAGFHSIMVEYGEIGNIALVRLLWEGPLVPIRQIIPSGAFTPPMSASNPNPANNATGVENLTPTLTWNPGDKAAKHDVYFSDNWDDVNEAKSSDPCGPAMVYKGRQDPNSYAITTPLKLDKTYYWRIDEVNDPNMWPGSIWSFTTRNYLIMDNFESYNNTTNRIQNTWIKGGGGTVGYPDANYAELTIVHGGSQAMPFDYSNTNPPTYSEATRTYTTAQDWTAEGVKSLTLWLRGYMAPVGGLTRSASSPYTYAMTASGTDINIPNWRFPSKMRDEFHYAYVQVNYECDIIAKVDSISNTDPEAKAGLMLRDSLADDSAYVMMCITPDPCNGIWYQYRPTAGQLQDSGRVTQSGLAAPHWLWLRREFNGSDYEWSGYYSAKSEPNQYDWTPLVSDGNIPVTAHSSVDTVYIGLVVTASNATATCTGVFSNVSVTDGGLGSMYNNWPARANPVALPWPCPNADIGIKSNNAAPLYVTLQDSTNAKKVTHPDPNIVLSTSWQEWNIALSDFTGVNLAAIKKITIGVDSMSTPAGTLYFDDIRLYIPRCISTAAPTSDCLVNYLALQALTDNWLVSNYQVTPAAPSDANLVSHYKFDGDFTDSAGNNDGEPNGALIINDLLRGQVANFDGVNDYVNCSNDVSLDITSKITLAAWVKTRDCGNGEHNPYVAKGDTSYAIKHRTSNEIEFFIYDSNDSSWNAAAFAVDNSFNNVWHHVAGTYDGSNVKLYIDGVLAENTAHTGSIASNTYNVNIGRDAQNTGRLYDGEIDEVRIYSRALSQGEIAYLAGKTASFTQPLYMLLTPQNPGINLYNDGRIDLKDYAVLADLWLEELLWP